MKQELFLKSLYRKSTLCCCIVFLLWGCAKVGTPSGGPKDVAPPKIVECIPPNNSTNFHGNKITIKCDELVDLDNVAQNLLISPPMAKTPKVIANGKKVQIMFEKNQLRDSTTYSFFFGKSIKDYNEGNFIENFTYAFSTGKTIDSLRISGKVTDVLNGNPMEDVYVMLYTNLADSAPKKELPIFISKTKKNGTFELRNVKQTKYRIYALKDANNDLKFNQPKETFAFYDSVIVPTIALKKVADSVKCSRKDSASTKKVTNKKAKPCKDTVLIKTDTTYSPNAIELKCFVEEQKTQFLANFTRETKEKVQFVFNMPLINDSLVIEPLKVPVTRSQILKENSSQKDTVTYWLVDKSLLNNDSLQFVLHYFKHDSVKTLRWLTDTVKPRYDARKDATKGHQICKITSSVPNNGDLSINGSLSVIVGTPVESIDKSKILLFSAVDTNAIKKINGDFYTIDTSKREEYTSHSLPRVKNYMPKYPVKDQKIAKYQAGRNKFLIAFEKPLRPTDSVSVRLGNRAQSSWLTTERDIASNSLYCWITDKTVLSQKRFTFTVMFNDSVMDTLDFVRPKISFSNTGGDELVIPPLQLNNLYLDEMIPVFMINPIDSIDYRGISLIKQGDTSKTPLACTFKRLVAFPRTLFICALKLRKSESYLLTIKEHSLTDIRGTFNLEQSFTIKTQQMQHNYILTALKGYTIDIDSLNKHKQLIKYKWVDNKKYQLQVLPGAVTNIYGNSNDSLVTTVNIPSKDKLGKLILTLKGVKKLPVIVQWCDKDDKTVLFWKYATKDTVITLPNLNAGDYKMKVIYDKNGNKKWDSGLFQELRQPETIQYFGSLVSIKSGWDNKLEWNISEIAKPEHKKETPSIPKSETKAK